MSFPWSSCSPAKFMWRAVRLCSERCWGPAWELRFGARGLGSVRSVMEFCRASRQKARPWRAIVMSISRFAIWSGNSTAWERIAGKLRLRCLAGPTSFLCLPTKAERQRLVIKTGVWRSKFWRRNTWSYWRLIWVDRWAVRFSCTREPGKCCCAGFLERAGNRGEE